MRRALFLALVLVFAGNAAAAAPGGEAWRIAAGAPCTGLTLGWTPPLASLAKLLGPGSRPAPGPVAGHGLLLIFVTRCPDSHIGGQASGPLGVAAVIVPLASVEIPGVAGARAGHAAALPLIEAAAASPVARLFARHAFVVRAARVSLRVTDAGAGKHAAFRIRTAAGTLAGEADFTAAPTRRDIAMSVLTSGATRRLGVITGPESSRRYSAKTARVSARGKTLVSEFHLHGAPVMAALDTAFTWDFRFRPPRARPH